MKRRNVSAAELRHLLPAGHALPPAHPAPTNGHPVRLLVEVRTVRMDTVEPRPVEWLWSGRIAFGKLTLLEGDPGVSKSTMSVELAARLSRGEAMPGGEPCEPCVTLFVTYEDGLEDTIAPRLLAARADCSRVFALQGVSYNGDAEKLIRIPNDVEVIATEIRKRGVRLVVIDPLGAALSTDTDSYKDADVRSALAPLARIAEETGAAIVIVRHLNKGGSARAIYAGGGSIGIAGAARAVLVVHTDPDDPTRRILAVAKNNLAAHPKSLAYRLSDTGAGWARVEWLGEVDATAEDLNALRAKTADDGAGETESGAWLHEMLADGPMDRRELMARASTAGFSERTIDRAKHRLGVLTSVHGFGKEKVSRWALPSDPNRANPASPAIYGNHVGNGGNGGIAPADALGDLDVAI